MVKIAWKVINGYGPYAYLQHSMKSGGKVTSKHLAYLGKAGAGGLVPGKHFQVAAVPGFAGGALLAPMVPDETLGALKPDPKAAVEHMAAQVLQGVAREDIEVKPPGKTAPVQGKPADWKPQVPAQFKDMKLSEGPEGEKGQPAISAPEVKQLETAAASEDPKKLKAAIKGLADNARHLQKKAAIFNAGSDLLSQVQDHVKAAGKEPAAWKPEISSQSKAALKSQDGKPLVSASNLKKLEDAAASGDLKHLLSTVGQMAAPMENPGKNILADAGNHLFHQVLEHGKAAHEPPAVPPKVAPNFKVTQVPKDDEGQPLISGSSLAKLEEAAASGDPMALQLTVSQLAVFAPGKEKTQAVYAAGGQLLGQMQGAAAPAPPQERPATALKPQPPVFKIKDVPKDAKGKPLISKANIKKLEDAAASGSLAQTNQVAAELTDMTKSKAKKKAIAEAFGELKDQHYAHQHQLYAHAQAKPSGAEVAAEAASQAPDTAAASGEAVAPNSKVANVPKSPSPVGAGTQTPPGGGQPVSGGQAVPTQEKLATAAQSHPPEFKLQEVPKDAKGKPLITKANIKRLEKAAASGDITQLHVVAVGLNDMTKPPAKKKAIAAAFEDLLAQLNAYQQAKLGNAEVAEVVSSQAPATASPSEEEEAVAPNFKVANVPKDAKGNPLVRPAHIKKMEEAAASGDFNHLMDTIDRIVANAKGQEKALAAKKTGDELVKQLQGNKKAAMGQMAGLLAQLQAKKAAGKPAWTKLEDAKGSTKGGVYENAQGEKFYLKCPLTPKHVQNELLARDLYKLAGLQVLEGEAAELDGEVCLASRWNDKLTGSGQNPKDLDGTMKGFAADAWLANWDSVGVGSSKYDNILNLDGQAVRVDTGGALLYHGTGAPKGDKFGLEVTEMEGLQDPKVNPVAATVFGDMTLDEIVQSAQRVLAIDAGDITAAVQNRFPGDPDNLASQLLVRRNNISAWLSQQKTQAQIAEEKDVPVEEVKAESVAPNPEPLTTTPKVGEAAKDNKGKALVSAANVKKLEKAAATGNIDTLNEVAEALTQKMLSPAKKSAILNACAGLKAQLQGTPVMEGDGGSGLAETVEKVETGEVELPEQSVPKAKVVDQQSKALQQGTKDYDGDLEQVSGKKGSNEGGLFKDKKLETLHYIKWPNSPLRAKVEALTALLYGYAQVPVPLVRTIEFQNKDAVMSDWIDEAAPMTEAQMKKHRDVRDGFAVDAWLANWDVVGLSGDNIVAGPGNTAYRIDLGGAMLFRAQGKPKEFSGDVGELETLRDPGVNSEAAKVFAGMTLKELRASASKVEAVTDLQIDQAVDSLKLPKTSKDYPASQFGEIAKDLPKMLKTRLKDRRDFIVEEVLASAEEQEKTAEDFQEATDLKDVSVEHLTAVLPKYNSHSPSSTVKWENTREVMVNELGKSKGASANAQSKAHYLGWKGSSNSPKGQVLRWAAGARQGEGRREMKRLLKFNDFLVKKGSMGKVSAESARKRLEAEANKKTAQNLVSGLRVANKQNEIGHSLHNPGKKTITLYRGWKADQLEYLKASNLEVGDAWELEDPPLYSWSTSPNVAKSFSGHHGSKITKAQVPLEAIVLSDLVNSIGSYEGETEVIFNGVPKLKTEVTHTF